METKHGTGVVYLIHNKINGMDYVGQTTKTARVRWHGHIGAANRGSTVPISRAIREFGSGAFKVTTLRTPPVGEREAVEKHYIDLLGTLVPHGYNVNYGHDRSHPVVAVVDIPIWAPIPTWRVKGGELLRFPFF
jgi:hypothetical protein